MGKGISPLHTRIDNLKNRELLLGNRLNAESLKTIEQAIMCITLSDDTVKDEQELQVQSMTGSDRYYWQDKCINVCIFADGQASVQGDVRGLSIERQK